MEYNQSERGKTKKKARNNKRSPYYQTPARAPGSEEQSVAGAEEHGASRELPAGRGASTRPRDSESTPESPPDKRDSSPQPGGQSRRSESVDPTPDGTPPKQDTAPEPERPALSSEVTGGKVSLEPAGQAASTSPRNSETRSESQAESPPESPHSSPEPEGQQQRSESAGLNGSPEGAGIEDEVMEFDARMVKYVQVVTSLIEGRAVSRDEVLQMLNRCMRQHSIDRTRRIDYILRYLMQHPP